MLIHGNNLEELPKLADNSIDAIITDPPYELGFMGKSWDSTGIAYNTQLWRECLRVLKPGGHLLAFSGSRTYHRMAVAIEDAGFDIRDQIMWVYGSGFPKSLDVSKAIDKAAGEKRKQTIEHAGTSGSLSGPRINVLEKGEAITDAAKQWDGWGTALKPAHEPIVLARKPLNGTVANNVLQHGTGALNIDACRVGTQGGTKATGNDLTIRVGDPSQGFRRNTEITTLNAGRFPANFIHDGSDEVTQLFPDSKNGAFPTKRGKSEIGAFRQAGTDSDRPSEPRKMGDSGSAARFFYCAKANKRDRNEGLDNITNHHPTVKPTELMRYLCRLITPPGGTILDPFTGSGSTGKAAILEGFNFIGIELDPDYITIAQARIDHAYTQRH
jgi:site-specific DNA-methyltransferase (adenine-specific)